MTTMEERWVETAPQAHVPVSPVTPHLSVTGGAAAIDFYRRAFGATELYRMPADDGVRLLNAHLHVNGSSIMLHDDFPEMRGGGEAPKPAGMVIHLAVDDCDRWFDRAVAAGGEAVMAPADMFWGDRYAQIKDPSGHVWSLGSPLNR